MATATLPRPSRNMPAVVDSLPVLLLDAAYSLYLDGSTFFPFEDLVVRAWQRNPERFGLHGYRERYPDTNKVSTLLSGKKGLVAAGLLYRPQKGWYGLTRQGLFAKQIEMKNGSFQR